MFIYDIRDVGSGRKVTCHYRSCSEVLSIPYKFRGYISRSDIRNNDSFLLDCHCNFVLDAYNSVEKSVIDTFVQQKGFSILLDADQIRVKSPLGQWIIVALGDRRLLLFHKNLKCLDEGSSIGKIVIPGYHQHKITFTNFADVLDNIYQHDYFRMTETLVNDFKPAANPYKASSKKGKKFAKKEQKRRNSYEIRRTLTIIESFKAEPYFTGI